MSSFEEQYVSELMDVVESVKFLSAQFQTFADRVTLEVPQKFYYNRQITAPYSNLLPPPYFTQGLIIRGIYLGFKSSLTSTASLQLGYQQYLGNGEAEGPINIPIVNGAGLLAPFEYFTNNRRWSLEVSSSGSNVEGTLFVWGDQVKSSGEDL